MVKREVPFVGTSTLLYSWKNLTAFFDEFGIEKIEDIDNFYKENTGKLTFSQIEKIIQFGLQRKDKKVEIDEVRDLMDTYLEENTVLDIIGLAVKAQMLAIISATEPQGEPKGANSENPLKTLTN
jgi:hypothetical protein